MKIKLNFITNLYQDLKIYLQQQPSVTESAKTHSMGSNLFIERPFMLFLGKLTLNVKTSMNEIAFFYFF